MQPNEIQKTAAHQATTISPASGMKANRNPKTTDKAPLSAISHSPSIYLRNLTAAAISKMPVVPSKKVCAEAEQRP